jgi:hypothetical protein
MTNIVRSFVSVAPEYGSGHVYCSRANHDLGPRGAHAALAGTSDRGRLREESLAGCQGECGYVADARCDGAPCAGGRKPGFAQQQVLIVIGSARRSGVRNKPSVPNSMLCRARRKRKQPTDPIVQKVLQAVQQKSGASRCQLSRRYLTAWSQYSLRF